MSQNNFLGIIFANFIYIQDTLKMIRKKKKIIFLIFFFNFIHSKQTIKKIVESCKKNGIKTIYSNKKRRTFAYVIFHTWTWSSDLWHLGAKCRPVKDEQITFAQRNVFEIILNQTEIRLYIPFCDLFESNGRPFGSISIGKW